jgi:cupin fold WbuC family metalloprotein
MPNAETMFNVRAESVEVLYAADAIVTVDRTTIEALKRGALANARRRIRLCVHRGVGDSLHEMLIVHTRDTYVRPHRHLEKCESFHVIEGDVDVVIFDEDGGVTGVIEMGSIQSGRRFFYRIADPLYHTLIVRSDVLVFHETTLGPFRREQTVFAPWAPEEGDAGAIGRFLAGVEARLRK